MKSYKDFVLEENEVLEEEKKKEAIDSGFSVFSDWSTTVLEPAALERHKDAIDRFFAFAKSAFTEWISSPEDFVVLAFKRSSDPAAEAAAAKASAAAAEAKKRRAKKIVRLSSERDGGVDG